MVNVETVNQSPNWKPLREMAQDFVWVIGELLRDMQQNHADAQFYICHKEMLEDIEQSLSGVWNAGKSGWNNKYFLSPPSTPAARKEDAAYYQQILNKYNDAIQFIVQHDVLLKATLKKIAENFKHDHSSIVKSLFSVATKDQLHMPLVDNNHDLLRKAREYHHTDLEDALNFAYERCKISQQEVQWDLGSTLSQCTTATDTGQPPSSSTAQLLYKHPSVIIGCLAITVGLATGFGLGFEQPEGIQDHDQSELIIAGISIFSFVLTLGFSKLVSLQTTHGFSLCKQNPNNPKSNYALHQHLTY